MRRLVKQDKKIRALCQDMWFILVDVWLKRNYLNL